MGLVVNMRSHLIVLFCVFLLFSFGGIEAKRRNGRKRQKPLKAWYGPVSTPDECKSEGRTAELVFKNNKKPSELCTDIEKELCFCLSPKIRGKGRKYQLQNDNTEEALGNMDFDFKCASCHFKWNWRRRSTISLPKDLL